MKRSRGRSQSGATRELEAMVARPTHERLFAVCELLRRAGARRPRRCRSSGSTGLSAIDRFWLDELAELVGLGRAPPRRTPADGDIAEASEYGYSMASLARLTGRPGATAPERPAFRMVDTAAAEFPAKSPYYYLSRGERDEMRTTPGDAVVVVGSGPIRIGQGIEFDYSCVHAAWALKSAGRSPVVVNNNPETVSTDFDISDALVFEPPAADEVEAACRATNARGVMLAFGGQTAINLAAELSRRGVPIVGSDRRSLDMAENREQFDAALARLGVARPEGKAARSFREARAIARELGFPVLVRPSFVFGGRAMEIVYNEAQLAAYAESAPPILPDAPLLVDKYLRGLELEVDAVFDGEDILIPGVFEHVERAGVHSGDSISVYPVQSIDEEMERRIAGVTGAIAAELGIRGLINIQFVVHAGTLYIIEANPRASRTVPIIQKATGINLVAAATRVALGEKLREMEYGTGLRPPRALRRGKSPRVLVLKDARRRDDLGPEMKSTGEVLGIDETFGGALRKGFLAAGVRLPGGGGRILVSIADEEKDESIPVLRAYVQLGHRLVATPGTRALLERPGIATEPVNKIADGSPHVLDLITSRSVDLVINDAKGPREISDDYKIRRAAVEASIACLTSLDTARALAEALASKAGPPRSLQEYRRSSSIAAQTRRSEAPSASSVYSSTLALVNSRSLRSVNVFRFAWTPMGVVLGRGPAKSRRPAGRALRLDRSHFSGRRRSSVRRPLRDLELLLRVGWNSPFPEALDERSVLNVEETPEELARGARRDRLPRSCSARRAGGSAYATISYGKRNNSALGIITRRCSENAVPGTRATTRSGTSKRCPRALTSCGAARRAGRRSRARPRQVSEATAYTLIKALLENEPVALAHGGAHARGLMVLRERDDQPRDSRTSRPSSYCFSSSWCCGKLYVQIVAAPQIAARATNPRHALLDAGRGRILASDGTVLAETSAESACIRSARRSRSRWATSRALRRERESRVLSIARWHAARLQRAIRLRKSAKLVAALRGSASRFARRRRRNDDRACSAGASSSDCFRNIRARRASCSIRAAARCWRLQAFRATTRTTSTPQFAALSADPSSAAARSRARRALSARVDIQDLHRGRGARQRHASPWIRISTIRAISSIGNFTLHDNESEATGYADLTTAFALSSNVDFAQIALKMGVDTFYEYLERWGIGGSLDFQLAGAARSRSAESRDRSRRARPNGFRPRRAADDAAADGADRRDDRRRRRRAAAVHRAPGRPRRHRGERLARELAGKPGIRRRRPRR